jgi:hypothetical protein
MTPLSHRSLVLGFIICLPIVSKGIYVKSNEDGTDVTEEECDLFQLHFSVLAIEVLQQ